MGMSSEKSRPAATEYRAHLSFTLDTVELEGSVMGSVQHGALRT